MTETGLGSSRSWYLAVPALLVAGGVSCWTSDPIGSSIPKVDSLLPVADEAPPVTFAYETIDLGTLGGASSVPTAIDSLGRVIGWSNDAGGRMLAFVWNGRMRRLETPDDLNSTAAAFGPGGSIAGTTWRDGYANVVVWERDRTRVMGTVTGPWLKAVTVVGVNHRREVLASVDLGEYHLRAMLFGTGTGIDIGHLASRRMTWALGIDSAGRVIANGFVRHQGGVEVTSPMMWQDGVLRAIGPLTGSACEGDSIACRDGWARDMNSRGEIVGNIRDHSGRSRPFVWRHGVMREIGAFPGESAEATLINDRGQILGHDIASSGTRFFIWSRGNLDYFPRAHGMDIVAMNNHGVVTGTHRAPGGGVHAFVRHGSGVVTDLGPGLPGASYSEPVAINDQGDVVGWSAAIGEAPRAVLWRLHRPVELLATR